MKTKQHVAELVDRVSRMDIDVPDFKTGNQVLTAGETSQRAQKLVGVFAPLFDSVDWTSDTKSMASAYRKTFEATAKVAAAVTLASHIKSSGMPGLRLEAALAGVDLPTFTRQLLMTITRVYTSLWTTQLFGVIPLQGPTGRLHFKEYLYDSSFQGSSPTITLGDRTDQDAKFNADYYATPEATQANLIREQWKNLDISTSDYRIASEWSDQMADDSMNVYGDDIESSQAAHRAYLMGKLVDRTMIAALIAAVPSANKYSWTAQPSSNPNYASLSPSEKKEYDANLLADGIQSTIHKIRVTRKFTTDDDPTWAIIGADFALGLSKIGGFKASLVAANEYDVKKGALRDYGQLDSIGVRFLLDPLLTVSSSSNVAIFGRRPTARGDVGLYWAPYINMQPVRDFYDTRTGLTTQAVRSRFGVVKPNTGVEAASSQLAEIYGQLLVV